jgi:hypothetical protein
MAVTRTRLVQIYRRIKPNTPATIEGDFRGSPHGFVGNQRRPGNSLPATLPKNSLTDQGSSQPRRSAEYPLHRFAKTPFSRMFGAFLRRQRTHHERKDENRNTLVSGRNTIGRVIAQTPSAILRSLTRSRRRAIRVGSTDVSLRSRLRVASGRREPPETASESSRPAHLLRVEEAGSLAPPLLTSRLAFSPWNVHT